ncbi:uncharacterized protein MELLADRAFT_111545 [Melampsora larici-populina 98AG31]|uniref:Uncharacterized protein n=1 Tax=Melampsora larici-populina (strain 98AG31 / pathotype 3-4-7) TaxID=747676 RepID=F4S3J4_MELLP|nr:uncharacterized protein MELLADRAFT_111545 [Melampsora larici-populina 98AG31]EGG00826.1 hypothetical protein MELLADRAFT_111545 [Melampsora larici-populina 98AG31]
MKVVFEGDKGPAGFLGDWVEKCRGGRDVVGHGIKGEDASSRFSKSNVYFQLLVGHSITLSLVSSKRFLFTSFDQFRRLLTIPPLLSQQVLLLIYYFSLLICKLKIPMPLYFILNNVPLRLKSN